MLQLEPSSPIIGEVTQSSANAAIGADYRFAGTPWHVNMQGRYGQTTKIQDGAPFSSTGTFIDLQDPFSRNQTVATAPSIKETHWTADFGMGYDFLRGMQINFGFRIAQVTSDITADTLALSVKTNGDSATSTITQTDRRAFFGAGPRVGLEGSVPIIGAWSFDYTGNAAILFGNTKSTAGRSSGAAPLMSILPPSSVPDRLGTR